MRSGLRAGTVDAGRPVSDGADQASYPCLKVTIVFAISQEFSRKTGNVNSRLARQSDGAAPEEAARGMPFVDAVAGTMRAETE